MTQVCVDASFALKLILSEPEAVKVEELWRGWKTQGVAIVAPWLFPFEVLSVLRRKVSGGAISAEAGDRGRTIIWRAGVQIRHHPRLWDLAWDLAGQYALPTVYDTSYLALAELLDCECWTADRRLSVAVGHRAERLRLVAA